MSRCDLVDVTMTLHHETFAAILVSDDGDREGAVWLPRAAIEIERTKDRDIIVVTMPRRLASDKGLI